MGVVALAASACLLAVALVAAPGALLHVAPTVALIALFVLGRYPGEAAYARRLAPPVRVPGQAPMRSAKPVDAVRLLPRGGALLATGLAGRAPPLLAG